MSERRPSARTPSRRRWVAALGALLGACAAASTRSPAPRGSPDAGRAPPAPSAPDGGPDARALPHGAATRAPLASVGEVALPYELIPSPEGRSVVFLAKHAGERGGWARRLDGETGRLGTIIPLDGADLLGVLDGNGPADTPLWITSADGRLCVSSYAEGSAEPSARACARVAPHVVVRLGARLALLELWAPPRAAPRGSAPVAAAGPASRPREVRVRWATPRGVDAEARPTGLTLDEPLAGLTLVGARTRAGDGGADVLWYDRAPPPAGARPGKLGWARLVAGSLAPSGMFIPSSRATVLEGEVTYGGLQDHRDVRLAGHAVAVALGLDAKGGCEATRALPPSPLTVSRAACAIAPDDLGGGSPPAEALARILAETPRLSPSQPATDLGLAAWAGDRAYFLAGGARLRSADRARGESRAEPAPFVGRRARVAWASFASDGEGLAYAGDHLVHVALDGRVTRSAIAALAPQVGANRRRAARIGRSWWTADGDVLRLLPTVRSPAPLRGRANREGTALVGGPARGLFLELSGGLLRASSLDQEGTLTALREAPSAVRAGFDACERGQGGALVVGPSAADPTRLVALTVGAAGETSASTALPAALAAGGAGVHLAPRPGGGAWLFLRDDRAERVLWLDDDGRVEGDAALPVPAELERAPCLDGRRSPRVPSPAPGRLVTPEGLGALDACLVGDVGWADEGREARWIGSATRDLDAIPELGVAPLPDEGPTRAPAGSPARGAVEPTPGPPPAPPPARCPGDMVSIAGRFCVDRFEAHLVDARTFEPLSPDYPLSLAHLARALAWTTARWRAGDVHAQALPVPLLPALHASGRAEPLARSERGARPSGYVSGHVAEAACLAAGKRLCSREEHRVACRGEADSAFPYGSQYIADACNVFRAEHPAAKLHGNASVGHLDPRLNRVTSRGEPLLRAAGATTTCRSAWGADGVYDLVGNLDEWVADPKGAFVGGFYARSTRAGCGATVSAHPPSYADYSTGVRCCRDAAPASR